LEETSNSFIEESVEIAKSIGMFNKKNVGSNSTKELFHRS